MGFAVQFQAFQASAKTSNVLPFNAKVTIKIFNFGGNSKISNFVNFILLFYYLSIEVWFEYKC